METENTFGEEKKKKGSKVAADLWPRDPICNFNYENAIENNVMEIENT